MGRDLFYLEFYRGQFQSSFYSASFYGIYFSLCMTLMFEAMQIITHHTLQETIWKILFSNLKIRQKFLQWFMDKQIKANRDKCQFTYSSTNNTVNLIAQNQITKNSIREKIIGVKFDCKLIFNSRIDDVSKKAGLNLNYLSRIAQYMKFNKKRLLVNVFLIS